MKELPEYSARLVLPPLVKPGLRKNWIDKSSRYGPPVFVLMDEDGNDVARLVGIQSADIGMGDDFTTVDIRVIAEIALEDSE